MHIKDTRIQKHPYSLQKKVIAKKKNYQITKKRFSALLETMKYVV